MKNMFELMIEGRLCEGKHFDRSQGLEVRNAIELDVDWDLEKLQISPSTRLSWYKL